jgi:hypothetical protein
MHTACSLIDEEAETMFKGVPGSLLMLPLLALYIIVVARLSNRPPKAR